MTKMSHELKDKWIKVHYNGAIEQLVAHVRKAPNNCCCTTCINFKESLFIYFIAEHFSVCFFSVLMSQQPQEQLVLWVAAASLPDAWSGRADALWAVKLIQSVVGGWGRRWVNVMISRRTLAARWRAWILRTSLEKKHTFLMMLPNCVRQNRMCSSKMRQIRRKLDTFNGVHLRVTCTCYRCDKKGFVCVGMKGAVHRGFQCFSSAVGNVLFWKKLDIRRHSPRKKERHTFILMACIMTCERSQGEEWAAVWDHLAVISRVWNAFSAAGNTHFKIWRRIKLLGFFFFLNMIKIKTNSQNGTPAAAETVVASVASDNLSHIMQNLTTDNFCCWWFFYQLSTSVTFQRGFQKWKGFSPFTRSGKVFRAVCVSFTYPFYAQTSLSMMITAKCPFKGQPRCLPAL